MNTATRDNRMMKSVRLEESPCGGFAQKLDRSSQTTKCCDRIGQSPYKMIRKVGIWNSALLFTTKNREPFGKPSE